MKLSFTKMQGCANDYIYLDCRTSGVPENIAALSERLSRRHFSIGADGIICICAPVTAGADAMMRIFNADGSEGKMCGNGIRCVAEWLYTHGMAKPKLAIDTLSGLKTVARMGEGLWQVEMGAYTAMAAALPAVNMGEGPLVDLPLEVEENLWRVTCISVGNPHCVTIVPEVDSLKLEQIGPGFEHHENFPERINTEFVQVVDATHLKMRVWERGSGETWACGTGTCATVAALTELGICPAGEDVHVQLRGGELTLYQVATVKRTNGNLYFDYTGDFTGCGVVLGDLSDSTLADQLVKYLPAVPAIAAQQDVNEEGYANITKLPQGLYLVVQTEASHGYEAIKPFLVSIPMPDGDNWIYDVDATPKVGATIPETPDTPDTPDVPDTPDTPDTPDLPEPVSYTHLTLPTICSV